MNAIRWMTATALCAGLLTGCGNGMIKPKGKITKGGAPIALVGEESLIVTLYPLTPEGKLGTTLYPAYFNPADSTFQVMGSTGAGMPPGKYRVAVEKKLNKKDLYKGQFDENNSKFVFDISSKTDMVIDLDGKS